jgi:trehalose 6-phosphate synthase/phosphatase
MDMPRLLIVSNRLPVTVSRGEDGFTLEDSSGGLATGMRAWHEADESLWFGWPGETVQAGTSRRAPSTMTAEMRRQLDLQLAERRLVPIHLTSREVRQYYEGFANGVIWPLFHYLLDRLPLIERNWDAYRDANARFADAIAREHRPGDLVWVHDYQLMLVPSLLRERVPEARIGFFLHIPFPSSEMFSILPWRRRLLDGLLGADLLGFHTEAYLRHFLSTARHVVHLEPSGGHAEYGGRTVRFGVFPMGIDVENFESTARQAEVESAVESIRKDAGGRAILLGIDRLDYTKGIPRRLLAFERLLERYPDLRDRVRLIQVAVPSRASIEPYQNFRRQVEEIVGRINGQFAGVNAVPIHYLYRSLSRSDLVALYRAADVMLVTPVRDGMNLVAKEFVASRVDEDGVLVLSEFAGAAAEMHQAMLVNPYDLDDVAGAIRQALEMDRSERESRMTSLRERVKRQDIHRWVSDYLASLGREREQVSPAIASLVGRLRREQDPLVVLLDYDGTLVPLAALPELARPDAELFDLLSALSAVAKVHIVSGRPRDTLEGWFASVPVDLWAEHGLWHRGGGSGDWKMTGPAPDSSWQDTVRPLLDEFARRTPGSLVETKGNSLAWHYRMADPQVGPARAGELHRALDPLLRDRPLEVLEGNKVVEVRARGVDKGRVVREILAGSVPRPVILAIGDDRTDEDMFRALPPSATSVHVGPGASVAAYRLPDTRAVRAFVQALASESAVEPSLVSQ